MGSCASAPVHDCPSVQLCRREHNKHREEMHVAFNQHTSAIDAKTVAFQHEMRKRFEQQESSNLSNSQRMVEVVAGAALDEVQVTLKERVQRFDTLIRQCTTFHADLSETQHQLDIRETAVRRKEADVDARLASEQRFAILSCCPSTLNRRVRLNVGGTMFDTTVVTLVGGSCMFAAMFNSKWFCEPPTLNTDTQCYDIFIDRDATLFPLILTYLRTHRLPRRNIPKDSIRMLCDEAEFYAIDDLVALLSVPRPTFDEWRICDRKGIFRNDSSFDSESGGNCITIYTADPRRAFTLVVQRGALTQRNWEKSGWFLIIGLATIKLKTSGQLSHDKILAGREDNTITCRVHTFSCDDKFVCEFDSDRRSFSVTNERTHLTVYSPEVSAGRAIEEFNTPFIYFLGYKYQFGVE